MHEANDHFVTDYEQESSPTDGEVDHEKTQTTTTVHKVKANIYFLAGSFLYLPPSVWDVMKTRKGPDEDGDDYYGDSNGDEGQDLQDMVYLLFVVAATLCYAGNGLTEIRLAFDDYQAMQRSGLAKPPLDELINGVLFLVAACFQVASVFFWCNGFLLLATHTYFVNAILTLWLGRHDDMTLLEGRLIRTGDCLFLFGAVIDMIGAYMESFTQSSSRKAWTWLASSVAWFLDAIFYLAASVMDDQRLQDANINNKGEILLKHLQTKQIV